LSQALPPEPFGVWVIVRIFCEHPVFFVDLLIIFGVKLMWYTCNTFALFPGQYTEALGKGNVTVLIGIL